MDFESFVEGLNKLGYKISFQGNSQNKDNLFVMERGRVHVVVSSQLKDGSINALGIKLKDSDYNIRYSDNNLNNFYNEIKSNDSKLNFNFTEEDVVGVVNSNYDGVNKIEVTYDKERNTVKYKGMVNDKDLKYLLDDNVFTKVRTGNSEDFLTDYLVVHSIKVENVTEVEDVESYLFEVKNYLMRFDSGYEAMDLWRIYEDIKDRATHYHTPEDVVTNIYEYPILGDEYMEGGKVKEKIYESNTDTAKKIRKRLKKEFKNTKFSVRAKGNAIRISWEDFPNYPEVKKVAREYDGLYTQQSYGDYGHDKVDAGYIDPEDGKRYTSPSYIFFDKEDSEEFKELKEYVVESRIVISYGLDSADYKYMSNFYRRKYRGVEEENEDLINIETKEDIGKLINKYKTIFEDNFKRRIKNDFKEVDCKIIVKNVTLSKNAENSGMEIVIKTQEKDKVSSIVSENPVIKGYGINVKVVPEGGDTEDKKDKSMFRSNTDGRDALRLKRFMNFLDKNKIKYKQGDNKKLPDYIVVDIGRVKLSFAPTFVVNLNNRMLIYDKHNDTHSYDTLNRTVMGMMKELNAKEKEGIIKVITAYRKSNDLRVKDI